MGSRQDISRFMRVGEEPKEVADELGPLSNLLGTWVGSGWNVIAVPDRQKPFQLLVRPIIETLTVTPLGAPVPNRSGPEEQNMFIHGVQYEQRVADAESHRPLHIENGMWLWLGKEASADKHLVRQSTIPHGDSLLAQGSASESRGRPPIDPELSSLPSFKDKQGDLPLGYLEQGGYFLQDPGFDRNKPNTFLIDTLEKQQVLRSVNLEVATEPGAIVNIPFVTRNANATSLHSIFWIETIMDPETQKTFQQLQYSQTVLLEFPSSTDPKKEMIIWPHISVATLIRQ
jgi:hypothetical protein